MYKQIIALCTILAFFFSGYVYLDKRHAKASDLSELIKVLTRSKLREELKTVNDRIWGYEEINRVTGLDREGQKTLSELRIDRCITIADLGIKDKACE